MGGGVGGVGPAFHPRQFHVNPIALSEFGQSQRPVIIVAWGNAPGNGNREFYSWLKANFNGPNGGIA